MKLRVENQYDIEAREKERKSKNVPFRCVAWAKSPLDVFPLCEGELLEGLILYDGIFQDSLAPRFATKPFSPQNFRFFKCCKAKRSTLGNLWLMVFFLEESPPF